MRGFVGSVLVFMTALALAGAVKERQGRGAHEFDLGPGEAITAEEVHAVELRAPGGVRTSQRFPRFGAVFVTRTPAGGFAVFPNMTPIAGCALVWRPPKSTTSPAFTDPCAGGQWDGQGRYISGPERQDLLRIPVTISDDGRVRIDTLDVSQSSPAEIPPEAVPEAPPPPPEQPTATSRWALVSEAAAPPAEKGWWYTRALAAAGRRWGLTSIDIAMLLAALVLCAGAVAYAGVSLWRARTPHTVADARVFLLWRNGRRWSHYLEPSLVLAHDSRRRIRVRLVNEGDTTARDVSVRVEVPHTLQLHLDARDGTVEHLPRTDGLTVRWKPGRPLGARRTGRVETVWVARPEAGGAGLTSVITVLCATPDGQETSTHVAVEMV